MRQLEQNLVCQMFGEEDCSFATARWAQVEPLAGERSKVIMSWSSLLRELLSSFNNVETAAVGIGAADTSHALEIVATRRKALPDLLDPLKAVPAVGGGVFLVILLAEALEVPFEYGVELVAPTGNVPVCRRGRDGDCRAHINIYGINELPASQGGRIHGTPHNKTHAPDAFSSLRACDGAGDADRYTADGKKVKYKLTQLKWRLL
jgi:hypothetical protein